VKAVKTLMRFISALIEEYVNDSSISEDGNGSSITISTESGNESVHISVWRDRFFSSLEGPLLLQARKPLREKIVKKKCCWMKTSSTVPNRCKEILLTVKRREFTDAVEELKLPCGSGL